MKKILLLSLVGLFYGLTAYPQLLSPQVKYTLPELKLTDSIPIVKMISLMKSEGFILNKRNVVSGSMLLDVSPGADGTYILLSAFHSGSLPDEKNIMGVFEFRGIPFYVKDRVIGDFLGQTETRKEIDISNWIAGIDDTPIFIFKYEKGNITLARIVRY